MKKTILSLSLTLVAFITILFAVALMGGGFKDVCNDISYKLEDIQLPKSQLYKLTDSAVAYASTTYNFSVYDLSTRHTKNGKYEVSRFNNKVIVKILDHEGMSYQKLLKKMNRRYDDKQVYICNGGTVIIEC